MNGKLTSVLTAIFFNIQEPISASTRDYLLKTYLSGAHWALVKHG